MAQALKERRPIRGAEAIAERPDGTRVTFVPYPTLLHDASGYRLAYLGAMVASWLAALLMWIASRDARSAAGGPL